MGSDISNGLKRKGPSTPSRGPEKGEKVWGGAEGLV